MRIDKTCVALNKYQLYNVNCLHLFIQSYYMYIQYQTTIAVMSRLLVERQKNNLTYR